MPFHPGHKDRIQPMSGKPLHPTPLALKVDKDLFDRIRAIPNWQDKLRAVLPDWASEWEQQPNKVN